jgi:hypothetical protein
VQSELPTVEELVEHGVSQNLLDFVSQLTVETFVAFPGEDMNQELKMTRWQENHCKYMLLICQEVTRQPNPSNTIVARTEGYTHAANVWALCLVQGPISVAPCQTLTLRFATFSPLDAVAPRS